MIYLFVSFNIIIFTNGYFTAMHVWTVNFNITYTIEMYVDIIAKFPRAQLWMTSSLIVCKRVIKLINHIGLNCFWLSTCIKYSSQTLTIIEMYSIEYYFYIMHLESRNDSILKFESNLKYQYDAFLTRTCCLDSIFSTIHIYLSFVEWRSGL